jgi:hypothetical protein
MNLETIVITVVAVSSAVGMLGAALESVGKAIGNKKLEAFGDKMEALGFDIPKLFARRPSPPGASS